MNPIPSAHFSRLFIVLASAFAIVGMSALGVSQEPPVADWSPPLGEPLPLAQMVLTTEGEEVPLQEYFWDQPVILMLGYNRCPMLCAEQVRGYMEAAGALSMRPGRDYRFLFFSIDPEEPAELAAEAESNLRRALQADADAVHFLRGSAETVREITQATRFEYSTVGDGPEFAHAAGLLVASPPGTMTHAFFGIRYPTGDLELALAEAGHGTVGSLGDKLLLLCYHYDPMTGRYGLAINRVLTVGALATIGGLGVFVAWSQRRARRSAMEA